MAVFLERQFFYQVRAYRLSPAMVEAHEDLQAALSELLKEFENVASAKSASSPLYENYRQAQKTKHNLRTAMNRVQFAAKVTEFVEEHKYAHLRPDSTTTTENSELNKIEDNSSQVRESAAPILTTMTGEDIPGNAFGEATMYVPALHEEEVEALQAYQAESHDAIAL